VALIEVPQMHHYHEKLNFLLEGVRFGYDMRNGGWDILDVFPIRHFD
jgi:hypothetical protein